MARGRSGFGALLYVSSKSVQALPNLPAVAILTNSDGPIDSVTIPAVGQGNEEFDWEKLGGITDFDGPGLEVTDIDITTHDTEGGYMQYAPGLKEPGEYSFDIVYDPTEPTHNPTNGHSFITLFDNQETRWWIASMSDDPNTSTDERNTQQFCFRGYVKSFENTIPLNDVIKASITIKIDGKVYFPLEARS